jgi:O-methyltransferase domain
MLTQVVERAKRMWGPGGQYSDVEASRVEFVPGSFFDAGRQSQERYTPMRAMPEDVGHEGPSKVQEAQGAQRKQFVSLRLPCTDTVPAAKGPGDVFVMRVVLHDWSDEQTLEILTAMRKAIGKVFQTLLPRS